MIYIGIDPGQGGGIAMICDSTNTIEAVKFTQTRDVIELLASFEYAQIALERVHSMPGQGVASMFTFGTNYGWWQGALTALGHDWYDVEPRVWQKHLGCLTKGDKNVTKRLAARLVAESGSNVRVTHAVADAICLAEYARQTAKVS